MQEVDLHWCEEAEINGYVRCNGEPCALCLAGKSRQPHGLLPVYLPASREVGVLPISSSSRPGALRPPILAALRDLRDVALLIRRRGGTYTVKPVPLGPDRDEGARAVAAFRDRWQAGEVDLAAAYRRLENRDLAGVPGVATLLRLVGVAPDDLG
jgi:hypothetical protein